MKNFFLMMAMLLLTASVMYAEDDNTNESQLKTSAGDSGPIRYNGYGGPQVKLTSINGEFGVLVGGRGALTINRTFSVGLAGYGLITQQNVNYTDMYNNNLNNNLNFIYGGLYFEYIYQPLEYIHCAGNVLIAGGGANYSDRSTWAKPNRNSDLDPNKAYIVIEPTLAIELNVTRFFRISAEASYRLMDDIWENKAFTKSKGLANIDLKGFSGGLTFEFGSF